MIELYYIVEISRNRRFPKDMLLYLGNLFRP